MKYIEEEKSYNGYSRMTDHANLYNFALNIIEQKGYKIFLWPSTNENSFGIFYAKKGNRDFDASDPLRLLGIITIWETHGDDWYSNPKIKHEKILNKLLDEVYPDSIDDYEKMEDSMFTAFVKKCQAFFTLGMFPNVEIKDSISRSEMFQIIHNFNKE